MRKAGRTISLRRIDVLVDKKTFICLRLLAQQVTTLAEIIKNHSEVLSETECWDLDDIMKTLKDEFELDD